MKRVKDHRYLFRRSDVFYFRRAVPEGAVAAFEGRHEVQKSLGTTRLAEARHLLASELEKFEQRVATATGIAAPKTVLEFSREREPSRDELEEGVRAWLKARLDRQGTDDYAGDDGLARGRLRLLDLETHAEDVLRGITFGSSDAAITTAWVAEAIVEANKWRIERGSDAWRHLVRTVGRGQIEASEWQAQDVKGEARVVADVRFAAEQYRLDVERQRERVSQKAVSLTALLDGYVAEAKPAASTVKAWRRQVRAFVTFLGHDDANKVALTDVVAWKERLLHEPNSKGDVLSARTVRDTYISVLKTIFKWATGNGKLRFNPTVGVQVLGKHKIVVRERGLSDAEAKLILAATMAPPPARLTPERALARRWVPWLCAYTGARVNEITQLRAEDVAKIDHIWTIRITPEAGSVKNGKARIVALHPHLVEQGFVQIARVRKGPLFYDPKRHRGGSEGNPQYKKVGEHLAQWVRDLGVDDPNVQPNHGWRHRFKTQARRVSMEPEVRDAIQGHVPRTEGEGYGDTPPEVSLREIRKLPQLQITG